MQTIARRTVKPRHASAVRRFKRTYAHKRSKLQHEHVITGHAFAAWFYSAFKEWRDNQ